MLFTREGYDLITNKFLYADFQLERSANFKISVSNNEIRYNIIPYMEHFYDKDSKYFLPIETLENEYFFSDSQLQSISEDDFMKYLENNKKKIARLLNSDRRFYPEFKALDTDSKRANYLMQVMSIKERALEISNERKLYR